ncbi:MAG: hypothetical protein OXL37_15090 [Chloroflexota bacterium]|nr:hypothetical protein [Chloroflexota bacterium]MDE2960250.1 hypothetical protein [Chloroflexota bacterium]
MDQNKTFTVINIVIALFSMSMAALSAYFAYESNRLTGHLQITAKHGEVDIYDVAQVPQEDVVLEGRLFKSKPPIVRRDQGFYLDIRNTGRHDEQIIKIGYRLRNNETREFQSPDPQAIMRVPPQIRHRLPLVVPAGQSRQLFWSFNKEAESLDAQQMSHVWFETARETIRVKVLH